MTARLSGPALPVQPQPGTRQVLVLLDDAAAGERLLAMSSALAQALKRDLGLVFVENSRSLAAAALPFTQVLSQPGSGWVPLSTQDVEQGFRAHAARLRNLAQRIAPQRQVDWSLRVVRGDLDAAVASLGVESDLLLLSALQGIEAPPSPARRTTVVAVARHTDAAAQRAEAVAAVLVRALDGMLNTLQEPGLAHAFAANRLPAHTEPDILVLPRVLLSPRLLAERRCPLLLVG